MRERSVRCKTKIDKYRTDYEENTERLNELTSNPDAIEQIAREKYLMKKPNEDIYVFKDKKWNHSYPYFSMVGAVMVLTGAATYISGWDYSPYLYLLGAACVALAQINLPLATTNKILKRLRIQQKFGGNHTLAIGRIHVYHTGQRMDRMFGHRLGIGTIYRFPYPQRGGQGAITKRSVKYQTNRAFVCLYRLRSPIC